MKTFFSPFAAIVSTPLHELDPFSLTLSCLEINKKKVLQVTIKDKSVINALSLGALKEARVQAVTKYDRPYLTIQAIDKSGEGKIINYKTHVVIRAENLPFFPKMLHQRKESVAYYSVADKSILINLPKDYTPLHDVDIPYDTDVQPTITNWPSLPKL